MGGASIVGHGLAVVSGLLILAGCTSSVLVRSDDRTFAESQRQLQKTALEVEKSGASASERVLFMQAESFYRYRFQPKKPGLMSDVIETAAAVTELPALESLAGSLDLLDLRYRAPDSAVQLWETLLAEHPQTPLRSLALYRLGWAYRSTGAAGLPREAPNDAFDELIRERPDSETAKLAQQAKIVPWKAKESAESLSIIPGLGQWYVGDHKGALEYFGVALLGLAAAGTPTYEAYRRRHDLSWKHDWPLLATGFVGFVILAFDYSRSYQDAMTQVVLWNEKRESEFERLHPEAP